MNPANSDLSQMIRCPVTKSDLVPAEDELTQKLNQLIATGELVNRIGQKVDVPIEAGFVNEDQSLLLPQRGRIVILISDQAIPLDQVD